MSFAARSFELRNVSHLVLSPRRAQLVLDAWISDDWESVTGNPGKLYVGSAKSARTLADELRNRGLSLLSIAFDLVFVLQHFVLYRDSPEEEGGASETSPLLDP